MKIEIDSWKLARSAEYAYLAGLPFDGYDKAIEQCKEMIEVLIRLKNHVGEWDDNDYCIICGADGRV